MPAMSSTPSDKTLASELPTEAQRPKYRIEQVADRLQTTKRTLRYYEEIGLLPPSSRTEGGYRLYSEDDIARLERIQRLKDLLGFSLAEIRELLQADDERGVVKAAFQHETDPAVKMKHLEEVERLTRQQLGVVEHKMAGLEKMRRDILERLEHYQRHRQELSAALEGQTPASEGAANNP
ncbi:MAG TPA: MerR family transcriptional regulator [Ktedonobacterales bacterium]|nr:MerR family transcriptional regulator [Ktedonobacterales bacterium]